MNIWRRFLSALGFETARPVVQPVETDLERTVRYLAAIEQRSEAEMVAWLAELARQNYEMRELRSEQWQCLTQREKQVAVLARRGLTNRQISAELGTKIGTTKSQLRAVLRKFGAHSRVELQVILDTLEQAEALDPESPQIDPK